MSQIGSEDVSNEGDADGRSEGGDDDDDDGLEEGSLGVSEGDAVGSNEGDADGRSAGDADGLEEGSLVGGAGDADGLEEGSPAGRSEGDADGLEDDSLVGREDETGYAVSFPSCVLCLVGELIGTGVGEYVVSTGDKVRDSAVGEYVSTAGSSVGGGVPWTCSSMNGVGRSDEEELVEMMVAMYMVIMRTIKRTNATMASRRNQNLRQQKVVLEASESVPQALDDSYSSSKTCCGLVGLGVGSVSRKNMPHPILRGVV
jgi:hypothetical protein